MMDKSENNTHSSQKRSLKENKKESQKGKQLVKEKKMDQRSSKMRKLSAADLKNPSVVKGENAGRSPQKVTKSVSKTSVANYAHQVKTSATTKTETLSKFRIPKVSPVVSKLVSTVSTRKAEYESKIGESPLKRKSSSTSSYAKDSKRKCIVGGKITEEVKSHSIDPTQSKYSKTSQSSSKQLGKGPLESGSCIDRSKLEIIEDRKIRSSSPKQKKVEIVLATTMPIAMEKPFTALENEDMDWENQVPAIRRLWNENSVEHALPEFVRADDEMEVDPTDSLIIVPDTNIWIGCVDLLKELLDTDFPQVGYPTIVIPWMVLQELDVNSKTNASQSKPSRNSVKFIHDLLTFKHPRVKGQKASDAVLSQMKFDDIVADDSILQCAFQLQKADSTVVFLSNDRNLCNKALVHGLITFDSHDVISKITSQLTGADQRSIIGLNSPMYSVINSHNVHIANYKNVDFQSKELLTMSKPDRDNKADRPAFFGNNSVCTFGVQPNDNHNASFKINIPSPSYRSIIGTTDEIAFAKILEALKNTVSYIIKTKMSEDFGENWICAAKIKPPWSLSLGVKCMLLHWIAVFSFIFGPKGKSSAEELHQLVRTYENSGESQQLEIAIAECAIGMLNMGKSSNILQSHQVTNCHQLLMNFVTARKS